MPTTHAINCFELCVSIFTDSRKRVLLASAALSHLAACKTSGNQSAPASVPPSVGIMNITSTDKSLNSPAILNPAENNGKFTVHWTQYSGTPYRTTVVLSTDQTLESKGVTLYAADVPAQSGSGIDMPVANFDNYLNCTYASDNSIDCGNKVDIQAFPNQLPKSAYIVIQSCLENTSTCAVSTYPVTLQ